MNNIYTLKSLASTIGSKSSLRVMGDFTCKNEADLDKFEEMLINNGDFDVDAFNGENMREKECNGMHARVLRIPKGTFLTGRVHREEYIDCLLYGKLYITSFLEDGTIEEPETVEGFQFFEGKPGRKRVLEALEDCLWFTVDKADQNGPTLFSLDEYRKSKKLLVR